MPFSICPYRRFFVPSAVMPTKFLTGASLCLALSLLWTPYDALARGAGSSHSSRSHSSDHHSSKSHAHSNAASGVQRDSHGRITRSAEATQHFKKSNPCPSTGKSRGACPGYVIDHVVPLKRGGEMPLRICNGKRKKRPKPRTRWSNVNKEESRCAVYSQPH